MLGGAERIQLVRQVGVLPPDGFGHFVRGVSHELFELNHVVRAEFHNSLPGVLW
jgi:hypothetical protein